MNRNQKRQLERALKKLGINQKVSVIQLEDGTYAYGFRFYTWTFEQLRGYITKRGFHYNANDDGKETRMWQAWLANEVRTDKLLMPTLLEDQDIILICPKELNAKQATEFAKRVDSLVNKYTKKWKRKELLKGLKNAHRLGDEAYEISDKDWKEQVNAAYATACLEFEANPITEVKTKWQTQGQAQTELVFATTQFISDPSKKKGIIDSPPGTGKTLIPLFVLEYLMQNGLMPTRGISIVATPWQSLCDKNAKEGDIMTSANGLDVVHLRYHSAAHVENRKKFTTSLQDASRERMYANQINYHLDRGKHVIMHVCFDSYSQLLNSLSLCDIENISTLWIDEVHKMVSTRPTEMNALIRNIDEQIVPVNKVISMTGTVDEFDIERSTFSGTARNYSMSNKDLFGDYIKRISYGDTVLQKLNLPFKVKGINRYHFDGDYVSGVKLNLSNSTLGENLVNSIIANVKAAQNGHEIILSMFRINDEARTVADQLKQVKKNSNLLEEYEIKCLTTVEENDPKKRNEILSDISEDSNQKYIVLLGPWAITGSNCPRADVVLWNYVPQSYITIVQGSLRACRMLRFKDHTINEAKKIFTVYFVMTEDVVKDDTFAKALKTLHSFLYSGNKRVYQAINELIDEDWFGPIDEPVIEDPMGEIIDLEEETVEEAEELSHILNRRLEDLLASSNTFDFSSTWNLSEELNKEKIQYLEDALLKFTLI